jgi:hypothetical protein
MGQAAKRNFRHRKVIYEARQYVVGFLMKTFLIRWFF